jgi:predicted nucleic acid-binding protein
LSRIVVDASVVVKWLVPEIHSVAASRLLEGDRELWAPDLVWAEIGNVIWKKWRQGELPATTATALLGDFRRLPLSIHPSDLLFEAAWEIAQSLGRSFYDSLYLALSLGHGCPLVTADLKLWRALQDNPVRSSLVWVEDLS